MGMMNLRRFVRVVTFVLVGVLAATPVLAAQTAVPQDQGATPPATKPPMTPAELDRIRRALEQEPVLDLTKERLRFYASVVAQPFSAEKILGDKYDLIYGPTPGGAPMTHREFLDMVTPKELYGSGGIQAYELLQWSMVNLVGQALLRKAFEELKNARTEAEAREIRARIDRELELLRRAGGGG